MAPKKVETAGVTLDIPDQPPSLETEGIMDDLLQKAKSNNIGGVEASIVQCLRMPNYRYDLRESIIVDFHVELLIFASENGYGPKKTLHVMHWANDVRRAIETNPNDESHARRLVKEFFAANVEGFLREAIPNKLDEAPEGAAVPAVSAPAAAKGKEAAKPPPKGSAPANKDDNATGNRHAPLENPFLSVVEVAPLMHFVSRGLLQHAHLYANSAKNERPTIAGERPRTFTFSVETPMRSLPLSRALTAAEVEAIQRDQDAKAQEELERLQAEEAAQLEAARLEEEARLEQQRQMEEEERANQLYFSKAGTAPAVDNVQQQVVAALSQRQMDILMRVAKLEADLGVVLGK
jgi:cell division protein FtsL